MKSILVIYASSSGNTELITDMLAEQFTQLGHKVDVKLFELDMIEMADLVQYDAILIGTYTWDDGDLPYEVEHFYIDLEIAPIQDKLVAVYGSADSCYHTFGGAIDLVAERAIKYGADVLENRLKIDRLPDKKDEKRCLAFVQEISDKIMTREQVIS